MSQEIVDAVREIEREKGIEAGTLVAALEDALLAAYKKTPGAARHALVELDDAGDFRVFAIELPPDLEERLLETKGQLAQAVSQNEKLSATLREARDHIAALREEVEKLTMPPNAYGTLLGVNDDGTADIRQNISHLTLANPNMLQPEREAVHILALEGVGGR